MRLPKLSLHDLLVVVYVFVAAAVPQLTMSSQAASQVAIESAIAAGVTAVINKYHKG
jgi:hypothetical protein